MLFFLKALMPVLICFSFGSWAFAQQSGSGQSRGNTFNPDTSVVGTFLYRNSNRGNGVTDDEPNGFLLDEAELQFAADIDVYLRANVIFAIHREDGEWAIEPEEAYVETLSLPVTTLKVGKFKTVLGKYNTVHAHALPFVDNQLISEALLGEEGLNGEGLSAAALIPAKWFSEFTVQAISPNVDPFKSTSPNGNATIAHFKNLWDLTDDLTMEWGLSGADGNNNVDKHTAIYGTDLTFKWRPSKGGKYSAIIWSSEFLSGKTNINPDGTDNQDGIKTQGGYTFIQWQAAQRWWLQARTEYVDSLDEATSIRNIQRKNSALVAFLPTEFTSLRLQYDHLDESVDKPENRVLLQLNISMGAHPAHSY